VDNLLLQIKSFIIETLFPSFCLGCQREGSLLCQDCKSTLDILHYNYCLCSKNPIRIIESQKGKCQRCQNKKLSGLYFALPYKEKFLTKKLIYQFKYPPRLKSLSKHLAQIIIEHLLITKNNTEKVWQNSIILPVPLEKYGLKYRGYNQSEELAKEFSKITKTPLILNNLIKIKETKSQTKLSAQERQENVRGVFSIKNPEVILNKKVFLIDDVYTTGSTMEECANVLRTFGAKSVWGIAIAREG